MERIVNKPVKSQYVCSYGRYDIFFQHNHYYVVDVDASIVYFARTVGKCERWIDKQYSNDDIYR